MAKIQKVNKCRKEQKCGKCGKTIEVGSPYYYAEPAFRAKIVRCASCGLKPYETSSSEYIQTIGALQDNWSNEYDIDESTPDSIISTLEELKDTAEDSLYNMPEQLQESDSGMILQDRIDALGSAIDELQSIDVDSLKGEAVDDITDVTVAFSELKDFYKDDLDDEDFEPDEDGNVEVSLGYLPGGEEYDAILDLPYISEDTKSELTAAFSDKLISEIDEIIGNLEC